MNGRYRIHELSLDSAVLGMRCQGGLIVLVMNSRLYEFSRI